MSFINTMLSSENSIRVAKVASTILSISLVTASYLSFNSRKLDENIYELEQTKRNSSTEKEDIKAIDTLKKNINSSRIGRVLLVIISVISVILTFNLYFHDTFKVDSFKFRKR